VVTSALTEPTPDTADAASASSSEILHVQAPARVTPPSTRLARVRVVLALAALFCVLAVAAVAERGQLLLTWDEPIQRAVEDSRTSLFDDVFTGLSLLGSTVVVLGLGTLAAAVTWRRCRAVATVLLVATFSRPALEFTLKVLVDRDRPDLDRMVSGDGPSFPSGHVMAGVALWGLMPLVVSLYTRRRAVWWASVAVAAALIAGIAASRVYLGVHWFSDVTGGLVVGAIFLLGVEALLIRQHARHPCRLVGGAAPPDAEPASPEARAPHGRTSTSG
jgi:membrane-associated phospholipid phosphatase